MLQYVCMYECTGSMFVFMCLDIYIAPFVPQKSTHTWLSGVIFNFKFNCTLEVMI